MKSTSDLLRIFTLQKIQSATETLDQIKSLSHPFAESEEAIEKLKLHLEGFRHRIENRAVNEPIIITYCKHALNALQECIPLAGFVERSTEVSGPVEFYGPFSRLVRSFLGEDAKLILSSAWRFSPHTIIYPTAIPGLDSFVYVGFCVSESDNAFLTPLAGHELGHNVWQRESIGQKIRPEIGRAIVESITKKHRKAFESHFGSQNEKLGDLVGQASWYPAAIWAEQQLQECFCDYIGLFTFGPSYLYAFAFFLAPGVGGRDKSYPPLRTRYTNILKAANNLDWDISDLPSELVFDISGRTTGGDETLSHSLLLDIADDTRESITQEIANFAFDCTRKANAIFDPSRTSELVKALRLSLPCTGSTSLASISDAAWCVLRESLSSSTKSYWGAPEKETLKVLNELILKSFEIYEIETTLKEDKDAKHIGDIFTN